MENNEYLHEVAITAIIIKDEKYLITRRSPSKKKFPGMWTVPGGRMEKSDYLKIPKDTNHHWYNVLEKTLRREVKEETALDIDNIWYVTSLAMIGKDGVPSLIISCAADYTGGEVKLQEEECDEFAWVSLEESKNYDLIEGIYEELAMAEKKIKGEKIDEWKKT